MRIPESTKEDLEQLFARMDDAYGKSAEASGFVCRGCVRNCCETLFYHHTLAEYLYLKIGLDALPAPVREGIRSRAAAALGRSAPSGGQERPDTGMCPVNAAGRCLLYAHRPMICRLHGIPHQLRRPDGRVQSGPGCDDFYRQGGTTRHPPLDRTRHYTAMAQLERELRRRTGFSGKIRMTIAQMVMADLDSRGSGTAH